MRKIVYVALLVASVVLPCRGWCWYDSNCDSDQFCGATAYCIDKYNDGECMTVCTINPLGMCPMYHRCKAGNGVCGCCGTKQADGKTCGEHSDCQLGFCDNPTGVPCRGTCRMKVPDGQSISCEHASQVLTGGCNYDQCLAGKGICGVCGQLNPVGAKCSKDTECVSGICQSDVGQLFCHGTCMERKPNGTVLDCVGDIGFPASCNYDQCWPDRDGICGVCGKQKNSIDQFCGSNADCQSGWCAADSLVPGVNGRTALCSGKCKARLPDGAKADCSIFAIARLHTGGCDYEQCESGDGKCGTCGSKVPLGNGCSSNSDCASGVCKSDVTGSAGLCSGECISARPNGYNLPFKVLPVGTIPHGSVDSHYDYDTCAAGAGVCGQCGPPGYHGLNAACSSHADCNQTQGLCCAGSSPITFNCLGVCKKQEASECPSFFTHLIDSTKANLVQVGKWASDFGTCLVDEFQKQVANVSNEMFHADFDIEKMSARLRANPFTSADLPPEARRLGRLSHRSPPSGQNAWEERPTVVAPSGAFMKLNRIHRLSTESRHSPQRRPKGAAHRQLGPGMNLTLAKTATGYENMIEDAEDFKANGIKKEFNTSFSLPCRQVGAEFCRGGAELAAAAELEVMPDFDFQFSIKEGKASIKASLEFKSFLGLKALAAGDCDLDQKMTFPDQPMQLLTTCYGPICISVWVQGRAHYGVQGHLLAKSSAYHVMDYVIEANGNLDLDPSKTSQMLKLETTKEISQWSFDARGEVSARVFATVGPTISIMITPGIWTTIQPTLTAEATMFGSFSVEKSGKHGDTEEQDEDMVELLNEKLGTLEVTCDASGAPEDKGDEAARLLQATPEEPKELSLDFEGERGNCFDAAISAKGHLEIITMGPPFGYTKQDLEAMMRRLCGDFAESMVNLTRRVPDAIMTCLTGAVPEATALMKEGFEKFKQMCVAMTDLFAASPDLAIRLVKGSVFCKDLARVQKGEVAKCSGFVGCTAQGNTSGWKFAELPDENYIWKMFGSKSCSNFEPLGEVLNAIACREAAKTDLRCGPEVLVSGKACSCVKVGSMCDNKPGVTGILYVKEYVGLQEKKETEAKYFQSPIDTNQRQSAMPVVLALIGGLALFSLIVYGSRRFRHQWCFSPGYTTVGRVIATPRQQWSPEVGYTEASGFIDAIE